MDFFDRVKELAKCQGTTIEQIMINMGSTRDVYNGWRHRQLIPRGDVCVEIANVLGVSTDYLLTGKDAKFDMSKMEKCLKYSDLISIIDTLPAENYKILIGLVKSLAKSE